MIELEESRRTGANLKVVGIGGGGCNAVNTMIKSGLMGVEFIGANTDAQALTACSAPIKVQLGANLTKGLGAGASPEIGRNAILEDRDRLREILSGADMVFITAGLGGGTGTGGAPILSTIAKEVGALTVAVVTKPFFFEGKRRQRQAEEGLKELRKCVDTLITIPNQRLLNIAGKDMSLLDAFRKADEVLLQAVQGISDLITVEGLINLDFADVRTVMSEMGMALMGTGAASGEKRAVEAAQRAISSPLLEDITITGARGILISVSGGPDLRMAVFGQQCLTASQHLLGDQPEERLGRGLTPALLLYDLRDRGLFVRSGLLGELTSDRQTQNEQGGGRDWPPELTLAPPGTRGAAPAPWGET